MTLIGSGGLEPKPPKKLQPAEWKANTVAFKPAGRVWCAHREKRPLDPTTERSAKSNNPATWRDWPDAAGFYERTQNNPKAGVGVMLSEHAFGGKGLIALDLDDALDEHGMLRPWARPYVEPFLGKTYVERSIGGRGVHVFILGHLPEGCTRRQTTVNFSDPEAPKAKLEVFSEPHFVTLSGDVLHGSLGLSACPEELLAVLEDSGALLKLLAPAPGAPGAPAGEVDLAELPRAVEALSAIDPGCDRQTWLEVGMALQQAFGPAGWKPWAEWSSAGANYAGQADCSKVWASFGVSSAGITLGTLFHHAKAAGWKGSAAPPRASAQEDFKDFVEEDEDEGDYPVGSGKDWGRLGLHTYVSGQGKNASLKVSEGDSNVYRYLQRHERWAGKLRYNERTMEVEVEGKVGALNLQEVATEVLWFCGWRKSPSEGSIRRAAAAAADGCRYDPVAVWLKGLQWDGTPRLDGLCAALGLEDEQITRRMLRRWLIGAVARALRPGCEMQTMLVLHGEQGKKKSAFFKRLAVKEEWYSESQVDMGSKDGQMMLLGPWIAEVAELTGMSRADVEKVKGFVSERVSKFRPPYGRKVESFPRRAVLGGTTNETEFLRDGTGARRFWLIAVVEELRLAYLTPEVVSQIWAEAREAFEQGERWWDEGEEVAEVSGRNEDHFQRSGLDVFVEEVLRVMKEDVTTVEAILHRLVASGSYRLPARPSDVAGVMKRLGWRPRVVRVAGKHSKQRRVWFRPGLSPKGERAACVLALKQAPAEASEFPETPSVPCAEAQQ